METYSDPHGAVAHALHRTVNALMRAQDIRDPYTVEHQTGVSAIARIIGQGMGLSPTKIDGLRVAGNIHDIGKMGIPYEILAKPAKLSPEETAMVRLHPARGAEILGEINSPWPLTTVVLQHHERLDGSGYPNGLVGDEIIVEAQIIAVADAVDSMLSDRTYRKAMPAETVMEELNNGRGTTLNPDAVDVVVQLLKDKGQGLGVPADSISRIPALRNAFGLSGK